MEFNFGSKGFIISISLILFIILFKYVLVLYRDWRLHQNTKALYSKICNNSEIWKIYATTQSEHNILYREFGSGQQTTLIIAGIHGDEQTGFHLICQLAESLSKNSSLIHKKAVLVPVINPDGLLEDSRLNSKGIDINRNFPTKNWTSAYQKKKYFPGTEPGSELETQSIILLIDQYKPNKIIAIHDDLHMNNFDGPAEELARKMAEFNGYKVTEDVGYPTPGSLGNYAGREKGIPVITLELPKISPEKAWKDNARALIAAINY
jgi:hypothetical protein